MLRAASMNENSFSIFTGDVIEGERFASDLGSGVSHLLLADIWLVNQTGVTSHLEQFNEEMQTLMNTPVFPAIGGS
jgi:sphingomyelin phosphodiesterase